MTVIISVQVTLALNIYLFLIKNLSAEIGKQNKLKTYGPCALEVQVLSQICLPLLIIIILYL